MNKAVSIFNKTLKVFRWIVLSFLLVMILITLLFQIPAVQTKLGHYTASVISRETHTKVSIEKINIFFPKSWVVEGIYLEDRQQDTLLYAGKVKINLGIKDLLTREIHVNSFILDNAKLKVSRIKSDSLFNYNFLRNSFGENTGPKADKVKKKSNWTFGITRIKLKNIRLNYDDAYGGTYAATSFADLKIDIDKTDMAQSNYIVKELLIESLNAIVLIKPGVKQVKDQDGVLPAISVNKFQIKNANLRYDDSTAKNSVIAFFHRLVLIKTTVDMQKQLVTSQNFSLSKSSIRYNTNKNELPADSKIAKTNTTGKNDWKISVQNLDLNDNSLAYSLVNKPEFKNKFDAAHLDYNHVTLAATGFFYSTVKSKVSIKKFNAVDQNNFSITNFETDFSMDQHSITAKMLKIKTFRSNIEADLKVRYPSLGSFVDSIQYIVLNADLKNVVISNADILYFNSRLTKLPFFKNEKNITELTGNITGPVKNLSGKNMVIKTGDRTILKTDFIVSGLPSVQTAYFSFPNLTIQSGKEDISRMADTLIPKSIELPKNLHLQIALKGKLSSFESTINMNSSYGSAHIFAHLDQNKNFNGKIKVTDFDLGRLLKKSVLFGPVSFLAETNGHGLDKQNIKAKIKAEISTLTANEYTYHNLNIVGTVTGQEFEGKVNLDDKNAAFDIEGHVNLKPNQEQYKLRLNLKGADLQKLHLTRENIRVGLIAESELKGRSATAINGTAAVSNIIIAHEEKKYRLDSFIIASINEPGKSELNVSSSLISIKYNGTSSPAELPKVLGKFIDNYFSFSGPGSTRAENTSGLQDFDFEIEFHNHPILSEVFFPQLKEFEPGIIKGKFDGRKNDLQIKATIRKAEYGTMNIKDLKVDVNSDRNALNYNISGSYISNSQIKLDNLLVEGKFADNSITANISSKDDKQNKKLLIRSQITRDASSYKLTIDPEDFYLMNTRWDMAADNYIEFGKQGFLIHHLFLNKGQSQVRVNSVNGQFQDDIEITIRNFNLDEISGIIEKDTGLVKGNVNAKLLLKRVNSTYGLIADAEISKLLVHEVPVGNFTLKAENSATGKFDFDAALSGAENNLSVKGFIITNAGNNSLNVKTEIRALTLKTLQAVSMGSITDASGSLAGDFIIEGKTTEPLITGRLTFNNVLFTPSVLNIPLQLEHETVQLKRDGLYFNSFTVLDAHQHPAVIDGTVQMDKFKNFVFAISVNTQDFLLLNTTAGDNKELFGRMIIDSKIDVKGPVNLPVITAKLKVKEGSNFTFAVPGKKLTTDKGEGVLEFDMSSNPILDRDDTGKELRSNFTKLDISSVVEIDEQATLRLLLDPSTTDSLVVRGDAALSFGIDRSGKMSLTGNYNLNEGSYLVSLESLVKRKFDIEPGSRITWNGDPMDADVSINATYSVRASPIDLVADQMSGVSETDKNAYKQQYPFVVLLKLRGAIMKPEIDFEIQLQPGDKGIFGGAVNAKLNMLGEDPSALNKQVFALLVLGRFVQENPFQTESGGTSMAVRSTVSKLLSAQLNRLSSKVIPGMDLDIGIQSYDDYQTGQAEGRTQVDIGVKKQFFNDRLTVQVGGTVDVEGEKAKQNSAGDLTSDFTLEYKITKDGRYRLKGFRHNQYEGAIEGQLIETGAGILYVRDFNKWKNFFKKPKNKSDLSKTYDNAWIR